MKSKGLKVRQTESKLVLPSLCGARIVSLSLSIQISKIAIGDFPGGPVVRTLCLQCRGCGFDPRSGNQDPTCFMVRPKNKNFNGNGTV